MQTCNLVLCGVVACRLFLLLWFIDWLSNLYRLANRYASLYSVNHLHHLRGVFDVIIQGLTHHIICYQ